MGDLDDSNLFDDLVCPIDLLGVANYQAGDDLPPFVLS